MQTPWVPRSSAQASLRIQLKRSWAPSTDSGVLLDPIACNGSITISDLEDKK